MWAQQKVQAVVVLKWIETTKWGCHLTFLFVTDVMSLGQISTFTEVENACLVPFLPLLKLLQCRMSSSEHSERYIFHLFCCCHSRATVQISSPFAMHIPMPLQLLFEQAQHWRPSNPRLYQSWPTGWWHPQLPQCHRWLCQQGPSSRFWMWLLPLDQTHTIRGHKTDPGEASLTTWELQPLSKLYFGQKEGQWNEPIQQLHKVSPWEDESHTVVTMIVMVMKKYSIDAIEMDGVDVSIVEHQRPHRRIRQVEI